MFIRATHDDSAYAGFRQEVRGFCEKELPAELSRKVNLGAHLDKSDYDLWFKALAAKRWHIGRWPKEAGGHGWGPTERVIFDEETGKAGAPWLIPFGVSMVGPVIYTFGNAEQKQKLPAWDRQGGYVVVPGLFGARRRLRSRGACARRQSGMATTMSSRGRRSGPRMRNMPTGFSASCARRKTARTRMAFPSC